ncbi:unnamed protein product [Paramecium primaurelia]|uniref:EGF-like domain-containing protein n=1 Tax=Paramecium primaurelia TaxID=5886 RepID=A0A8S1KW57_PARPR|nr:unnamed protein product [Paramecium primaurelia]
MLLQILLLCLINCQYEPVLIARFGRSKNKLENPAPQFECVDEIDEDDQQPKEYTIKVGTLYQLTDGTWYLKSTDPASGQMYLMNLNDITRVKYVPKEDDEEKKKTEDRPEQILKEFEWTPLIAYESFPRNRGGHSMHAIGDIIVVFGGCFLDIKCFDDLFLFDARTRVWTSPRVFGIPPVGRTGFGALVNGAKLYIFGGYTLQGLTNDLFVFDLESKSWNQLFWPGIAPTPRAGHKMVLTAIGGIVFGGFMGEKYSNDVYILDIVNEKWLKPVVSGDIPIGRESFSMISHHGVAYIFGGYATGVVLNDVYTINEDLTWEKKEPAGKVPSPRQGAALAEYDHRIFIAGGCNPKTFECYNDLYAFDTTTNHYSTVNAFKKKNLKAVEFAGMVFAGQLLIHFGGCKLDQTCSDSLTAVLLNSNEQCPPCRNGGVCRVGHCSCQQGWQGIDCTLKVLCRQNCLGQGTCLSNGYCRCYPGFTGSICQLQIPCPSNCTDAEHGECQLDGKCKCKEGFSGSTCGEDPKEEEKKEEEICKNKCNRHGKCNYYTGLCECDYGFSGPDCSVVSQSDDYKSIWQLLKDDDNEPETGTTNVNMQDFISTGYKFKKQSNYYISQENEGEEDLYDENFDENNIIKKKRQYQTQSLESNDQNITNYQLTMVPPKAQQEEDPYQLMLLDECPKRCSEHGVCIEHECYCWFGYSGDYCQASKIADFYLGWRKKKVMMACLISLFVGMMIGYCVVLLLRKRGNDDEFRNMSKVPSQIDDNEGEVEELIV